MSMAEIDYALITAYRSVYPSLPTAFEGKHFTPPGNLADWASVFVIPASIDPFSLGEGGKDMHTGVFQIDFNIKPGKGRADLITYAQAMIDLFVIGKSFSRNSQYVTVTSTARSGIRLTDGYLRISVSVNFEAETIRPEI